MIATKLFVLFLAATAVFAKIDQDTIISCAKGRSQGRMYPDPDDCRKFIRCVSKKPVSFTCPPNTAFDPDTQVCAWRVGKNGCGGKLAPTTWVGVIDNLINDISQKDDSSQGSRKQEKVQSRVGWESPQKKTFDQADASKQAQKYANLEKTSRELVGEMEKTTTTTTATQSLNVRPLSAVQRKPGYAPSHKTGRTSPAVPGERKESGNSKYRRGQEASKPELKAKTRTEIRTALNVSETVNASRISDGGSANSTKNMTGNVVTLRTTGGVREKATPDKFSGMRSSGSSLKSASAAAMRTMEKVKVDVKPEAYIGSLKDEANETWSNVTRQDVTVTSSTVVGNAKINATEATATNRTELNVTGVEKVGASFTNLNGSKTHERRTASEVSSTANISSTLTWNNSSSSPDTTAFAPLNSTSASPSQNLTDPNTTAASANGGRPEPDAPVSVPVGKNSKQISFRNAVMRPTPMTMYMAKSAQPKKYAGAPRVDFYPLPQPYRAVLEQRSSKYSKLQEDASSTVDPTAINQARETNQTAANAEGGSKIGGTVVATSSGMDMSRLAALRDILRYMTGKIVDRSKYQDKDGDRSNTKRWYDNVAADDKTDDGAFRAESEAASERNASMGSAEDNAVDPHVSPREDSSDEEAYDFAHETQESRNQSSVVPQLSSVVDSSANVTNDDNTNSTASPRAEVKPEPENANQRNLSLMASPYMVKGLTREFACPKPNGHFADPKDCSVYYHCAAGIAYRRDCMTGQVFLPEAASCVSANLAPPCIQAFSNKVHMDKEFASSVCVDPNGMYRDTFSCSHYFECTNGWPIRRKCMSGTVFDEARGRCTWSRFVPGCEGKFSGDSDKASSDVKESFDCPRDGFFRDQDDCSVYYLCAAGEALRMTCEQGTSFDVNLNMCVWTYLVEGCEDRGNNLVVSEDKGHNPRQSSEEQRWNDFSCPEENGVFPDPEDCGTYFTCMDDVAKRLQCPYGTGYDDVTSLCIDARQVPRCSSPRRSSDESAQSNFVQQPFVCPKHHGLYPDPHNCTRFIHCFNDTAYRHDCMPGTAFSSEKGLCTWHHLVPECSSAGVRTILKSAPTTSATAAPPAETTAATTSATSPSKYASSSSAPQRLRATTPPAPAVQVFKRTETKSARNAVAQANPETMVSSEPYLANNEDSSSPAGVQDFQCPSVLDGFYRDNLFCDIFHRCVLGTRFTFTCPTGTFFRMEGNLCDFWETVSDCTQDGIRLEAITSLPEVAPEPSPLPVPHQGPNEVDVDVISIDSEPTPCPASSGLFAHPRNCKQFLFCAHNVPLVLTCPETLLYNSQTLTCDFAKNVRCVRYDHYQK